MIDRLAESIFGWIDKQLEKVPDGFFPLVALAGFLAVVVIAVWVLIDPFIRSG